MIPRKTNYADLEHKRSIFFEIGFVVSLAIVFLFMELNFKDSKGSESKNNIEEVTEQEMVPITRQEQVKPPPAPRPIRSYNIINIVDDNVNIEEELEIIDSETSQDEEIEVVEMPEIELEEEISEASIFIVVEEMPIFRPEICKTPKEGNEELMKYIANFIRYPVAAAESGVEGKVFVSFVVSPQGKVSNVVVIRGVHPELDKEAIRVVENLPMFSPGKQRGKPVRVQFSVPINFVLH